MCRGVEPSAKGFSFPWNAKNNTDEGRRVFSCAMCYIQTSVQTPYHKSVSVEYKSKSFLASSSYHKNHMKCFLPLATTATLFVKCQRTRVICIPSVCVCVMHVCVPVCICMCIQVCTHMWKGICVCMFVYVHVYVCSCEYTCLYKCIACLCVYVWMLCTYVFLCVYLHVQSWVCVWEIS